MNTNPLHTTPMLEGATLGQRLEARELGATDRAAGRAQRDSHSLMLMLGVDSRTTYGLYAAAYQGRG